MEELGGDLKQLLTRHHAPPGLRRRVQFMLNQQSAGTAQTSGPDTLAWAGGRAGRWPVGFWMVLSFACGLALMAALTRLQQHGDHLNDWEQQLVTSHVRSLLVNHEVDIASSNRHTVKPWFVGKIDYAPVVNDFTEQGFALVGGRLDYADGHAIAALVYHRGGHAINLFVRPDSHVLTSGQRADLRNGYALVGWTQDAMEMWAITDASMDELRQFVALSQATAFKPGA